MECNHKNTQQRRSTREVAGLKFKYTTQQCIDCEAMLWSSKNEVDFHAWLAEQKKNNRGKFVLQRLLIPAELVEFASSLANSNTTNVSSVYRAALVCYFVYAPTKKGWREFLDDDRLTNQSEKHIVSKLDVKPGLFLSVEANAKLFSLTSSAVASWAISRVLQAALNGSNNTDRERREHEVLTIVETALAA